MSDKTGYLIISLTFLYFIILELKCCVIINTKEGQLKGLVLKSRTGANYYAYLGIPYAKPPLGECRFQPPQPPDKWTGERDATTHSPVCPQLQVSTFALGLNVSSSEIIGEEDCLYLNVYTSSNTSMMKSGKKLPVMVYFHAGGFVEGAGSSVDPLYFFDHKIVVVTFNYRLGILGFLSAADEILPGNYGMKDQVAALKWVKRNIEEFGGDSDRITIFGHSAGGTSVHYHLHSPLSEGLFHRAISQSGTAFASWAQISQSVARQKFRSVALLIGCPFASTRMIVECLRKISIKDLVQIHSKFFTWDMEPSIPFPIVVEPKNVIDAFLTNNPWKQDVLHEVPWIIGFTSGEGGLKAARYLSHGGTRAVELNSNYKRLFPIIFFYLFWLKPEHHDQLTESLKQYYFGDKEIGFQTAQNIVDMITDGLFAFDSLEAAIRHPNNVYLYYYDHENERSFNEMYGNSRIDLGVSHADDIISMFPIAGLFPKLSSKSDLDVSKRIFKNIISFAYNGKPGDGNWKPLQSTEMNYLHITTTENRIKRGLLQERYKFWKKLSIHASHIVTHEKIKDEL